MGSRISEKEVAEKVRRYEALKRENEPWQPEGRAVFPTVLFISDTRYAIESNAVRFVQVADIADLFPKRKKFG